MNAKLSKAEFLMLVDAYLHARDRERWQREHGTQVELVRAIEASARARTELEKAVFP